MTKYVRTFDGGFVDLARARGLIPTPDKGIWRIVIVRGVETLVSEALLIEAGLLLPRDNPLPNDNAT